MGPGKGSSFRAGRGACRFQVSIPCHHRHTLSPKDRNRRGERGAGARDRCPVCPQVCLLTSSAPLSRQWLFPSLQEEENLVAGVF